MGKRIRQLDRYEIMSLILPVSVFLGGFTWLTVTTYILMGYFAPIGMALSIWVAWLFNKR